MTENDESLSDPFSFFDRIVCINFKHKTDNYASVLSTFATMGIQNRIDFYQPELPDEDETFSDYTMFNSHIKVIRQSFIDGHNNILIFEDSIKPTKSYNRNTMLKAVGFMSNNPYDILHLGFHIYNNITFSTPYSSMFITNDIVEFSPNSSFAYCLSRDGMEIILNMYDVFINRVHLNYMLSSILLPVKKYCFVPMLFEQYICYPNADIFKNLNCYFGKLHYNYWGSWLIYTINKKDLSPIINIVLILFLIYFVANSLI